MVFHLVILILDIVALMAIIISRSEFRRGIREMENFLNSDSKS